MTIRHLLIVAVLVAAVVWVVTLQGSRASGAGKPPPVPVPQPPVHRTGAASQPTVPLAEALTSASGAMPAWRAGPASAPAAAPDPARTERQARMTAVKRALDQLGPQDRQDPRKVSDTLWAVEKANGSPNLNGIRLDVLRQNLAVASELQTLTTELQALRAEIPEGRQPPPALADRIKSKLAQISGVQKRIRTDFMDTSAASGQ